MKLYLILLIGFIALSSCTKDQLDSVADEDISITLPNGLVGTTIYVSLFDQTQGKFIASKAKTITVINDTCSFKVNRNTTYNVYASNVAGLIHSSFATVDPTTTLYKTNNDVAGKPDYINKCATNIISGKSPSVIPGAVLTSTYVEMKSRLCSLRVNVTNVHKSINKMYLIGSTMVPSYIVADNDVSTQSTKYLYENFTKTANPSGGDYYAYYLDVMCVPPSNKSLTYKIYDKTTPSDIMLQSASVGTLEPNNIYILNYTMKYGVTSSTVSPYGEVSQGTLELVSMDVLPQTLNKQ